MICGCGNNGDDTICDGEYKMTFIVKNETDYKIDVVGINNELILTLNTDQSDKIVPHMIPFASCNPPTIEEFVKLNPDYIDIWADRIRTTDTMIVDDSVISDDVWQSEHWKFEPDPIRIMEGSYILIITDELLASLPSPTE
jgi:hypothetical protein